MSYQKQRNPGDTSAYSGRKSGAPGYQTLSRQLEAGSLPRVILLYGAEEYLIRWMISQITARYVPEETRFFNLTTFPIFLHINISFYLFVNIPYLNRRSLINFVSPDKTSITGRSPVNDLHSSMDK